MVDRLITELAVFDFLGSPTREMVLVERLTAISVAELEAQTEAPFRLLHEVDSSIGEEKQLDEEYQYLKNQPGPRLATNVAVSRPTDVPNRPDQQQHIQQPPTAYLARGEVTHAPR